MNVRVLRPLAAVCLGLMCLWGGCARLGPPVEPAPEIIESPGLARLDFRVVVREAKDKVFPSVVFVKCIREGHESGKKESREVAGSGVVVSPDGEVLTNRHVVDKAIEVRCLLYDGRHMEAKVLGTDKDTDLALLKLKAPDGPPSLPHATLGDSTRLKEGDFVMAMGAPWGLTRSVSIGIIACPRRYLDKASEYHLWLQTDASISPGNSGGPLVNTQGEVVGLNTMGALFGGDLGFALPSAMIRHLMPQLREFGRVNWSWTGLLLQPLKDFERNIYFEANEGCMVAGTDPDSPAAAAGIQPRDRIVSLNGEPFDGVTEEDLPALRLRLALLPKGKPAVLALVRDGKPLTVEVTPREKGKVEGDELACPRWDFTVKTINQFDNPTLHFVRQKGVFIFGVKYPGNAASAGLQHNDILTRIGDREVTTLDDVREAHRQAMAELGVKTRTVISVLRNGLMRQFVLDYARDYEKE